MGEALDYNTITEMNHFYQNINGFFTWPRLYRDMVKRFPSGSLFVEVGVYEGQSLAYLIVEVLNSKKKIHITAVDSFKGNEDRKDNEGLEKRFKDNLKPVFSKYHLMVGNSTIIAEKYYNESLDFVFIDADHTYESVKNDILAWLPKVKKGGVIMFDLIPLEINS